jgi:phenylacetate-CoA ligase
MDRLTVRVESRRDIGTARRLAAGDILKQHIKNRIGVSVLVDVLEPESIERSVGKARRLIDRRPTD